LLPFLSAWSHVTAQDIDTLRSRGEIRQLIGLLENRHRDVPWLAAEALGATGPAATGMLVQSLDDRHVPVRLGALEALAAIRDPACTGAVIDTLEHDPNTEVRWAAAIALGQLMDQRGVLPLKKSLGHPDKFVRFGAAGSLTALGWHPENPSEEAALLFAGQDWAALRKLGRPAVPLLVRALSDTDRDVRDHAVEILGDMRAPELQQACDRALRDADGRVRWKAVLASKKCGVPMMDLPLFMSRRPRTRPNPAAAAVLNLFFLGLGYNYLGKWWGFLIFMSYMTFMLILSLEVSLNLPLFNVYPNLYSYPVTAIVAYHTYRMAKKVPDL
jgi:hypothetical protein